MEMFNSSEVGQKVAHSVLDSLNIADFAINTAPDQQVKIPDFTTKVTRRCILPGHVRYFAVYLPSFETRNCVQLYTSVKNEHVDRYTSLFINKNTGRIEAVTFFGRDKVDEYNLSALIDMPASYCNLIMLRYKEKLITDFVEFFRENWALLLMCDSFVSFSTNLKTLIKQEKPFEFKEISRLLDQGQFEPVSI